MEHFELKNSIDDWQKNYAYRLANMHKRDIVFKLPKKHALAISGVRRCGKTHATFEISQNKSPVFYYNFEDPLFWKKTQPTVLDELISIFTQYYQKPQLIIFDEIQNVEGWEKWVRKNVDTQKYPLIITGSSAKLLSSELSTSIAGRCLEEKMWPLSFKEFLQFQKRQCADDLDYLSALREYLQWGGYPEIVLEDDIIIKKKILQQYLNDIVLKDIIDRHQIRNKKTLDQMLYFYSQNISNHHSYFSIKKAFGINVDTCAEYTSYLSEAFLFFEVPRFHYNLKVQVRDSKKVYCVDTGLRNAHVFSPQEDWGKLAENLVYIELLRRECEVSYFKDEGEVDFIVHQNGRPLSAIQVCYSDMREEKTFKREVSSLEECLQKLKLDYGLILTLNRSEKIKSGRATIEFMPLYKWAANQ